MSNSYTSTGWGGLPKGNGKPVTGSGLPGGVPGDKLNTHYPHLPNGPSGAKAGGALPDSVPSGGRSTNYYRNVAGRTGGGAPSDSGHNASAGRIREVGAEKFPPPSRPGTTTGSSGSGSD